MTMKRAAIALTCLLSFAGVLMATSGAHFFSADAAVSGTGQLCVTFDEAGVGSQTVNYTLTCNAVYDWGCINGGGNHPKATNKDTQTTPVSGGGGFTPMNGRVSGTVCAPNSTPAPPSSFSCPSGQTLVLADASYAGCVFTDITNNVSVSEGDGLTGSFSRTFFSFK